MSRFGWGKAKSSYAARRVPTSANIFLITKAFSAKTDLPTSRVAFKRFPTKGFGAGGVALTPPVNLPCRPALVILNWSLGTGLQIVGTGFIARQQAENYHWKQLIADPSSFRLNTKRNGRLHGRSHVRSDGRLTFV